jgi:hypothetical protein
VPLGYWLATFEKLVAPSSLGSFRTDRSRWWRRHDLLKRLGILTYCHVWHNGRINI